MIKHPLATEKSIRLIDAENKLVFVVDRKATKTEIKAELIKLFKIKITKLNTMIGPDGKKRAYVTLSKDTPAIDLATKLGVM